MKEEKSLVKIEQKGLWNKIKRLLSSIFGTTNEFPKYEQDLKDYQSKSNFKMKMQVARNEERERLLNLQKDFENNLIEEDEISEEDTVLLHELYDEQIKELELKMKQIKASIEASRSKLNVNI